MNALHPGQAAIMGRQALPGGQMVWIPGGEFLMGSDRHYPEEAPAHRVSVGGFWMDRTPVTNRAFGRFVDATDHVTLAERPADGATYPGAPPEALEPASAVFVSPPAGADLRNPYSWWAYVRGACWRHPSGPGSSIDGLDDHPVVHVAYEDAVAYARWAGKRLPTEAEWEFAARGGLDGAEFVWGDRLTPGGRHMANTWQGEFPWRNLCEDGFDRTSPVETFPANAYGLFDMAGNVWEWTCDWYDVHSTAVRRCCGVSDPEGARRENSRDPMVPGSQPRKVIKGGSFLCAPGYCQRYRPAARLGQTIDTSTCHVGFRCVVGPGGA